MEGAKLGSDYVSNPVRTASKLESFLGRLDGAHNRVSKIEGRLTESITRLLGESPDEKEGGNAPQPVRSGVFGQIEDMSDALHDRLTAIEKQIERLERFI